MIFAVARLRTTHFPLHHRVLAMWISSQIIVQGFEEFKLVGLREKMTLAYRKQEKKVSQAISDVMMQQLHLYPRPNNNHLENERKEPNNSRFSDIYPTPIRAANHRACSPASSLEPQTTHQGQ